MVYDIPRCSRVCAATHRELTPGEVFYSVLFEEKEELRRIDYSVDGWLGPPKEVIGYWKSKIPSSADKKAKIAPNEILLNFFDQLSDQPEKGEIRYVLVLLLIRRRLFRLEMEEEDKKSGLRQMTVYCPKRDATYTVSVEIPSDDRVAELQNILGELLYTTGNL